MSSDELARKLARRRTGEVVFQSNNEESKADFNEQSPPASPRMSPLESPVFSLGGESFGDRAQEELAAKLARRRQSGETVYESATTAGTSDASSSAVSDEKATAAALRARLSGLEIDTKVSSKGCSGELAVKLAKRRFGEEIFSGRDDHGDEELTEAQSQVEIPASPGGTVANRKSVLEQKAEEGRAASAEEAAVEAKRKQMQGLQKLLQTGMKAHQADKWDAAEDLYLQVLRAVEVTVSATEPLSVEGIPVNTVVAEALHLLGALRMQRQVAAGDAADSEDEDNAHCPHSPRKHERINAETISAVSLLRCAMVALPRTEAPERRARQLTSLGTGLVRLGDEPSLREAVESLREASKLAPQRWSAHFNLARALNLLQEALDRKGLDEEAQSLPDERVLALQAAHKLKPGHPGVLYKLGVALKDRGHPQEAIQAFTEYIDLAKATASKDAAESKTVKWRTASVLHWLAVLRGDSTDTAPADYVAGLFDSYAEKFDQHLVQNLGYSTPQLLADEIKTALKAAKGSPLELQRCADLGCGTGLMAPLLKDLGVQRLEGVDLSQGMLKKAEERGGYDRLVCGDLLEIFKPPGTEPVPGPFDLIVAADVFVYLGDLQPVLTAITKNLRKPNGLVAVSTEAPPRTGGANEASSAVAAGGFGLAETGRYMHTAAYVRTTGELCGLQLTTRRSVVLRYNAGKPVHGHLHILRHAAPAET